MKKVVVILYAISLFVILSIPIYIKKLEPHTTNEFGRIVERGLVWGPYGYVRVISFALVYSLVFYIMYEILSGKFEEQG